jgi:hypothetical protein
MLWPFGVFCGNLAYFFPFWYIAPNNLATLFLGYLQPATAAMFTIRISEILFSEAIQLVSSPDAF